MYTVKQPDDGELKAETWCRKIKNLQYSYYMCCIWVFKGFTVIRLKAQRDGDAKVSFEMLGLLPPHPPPPQKEGNCRHLTVSHVRRKLWMQGWRSEKQRFLWTVHVRGQGRAILFIRDPEWAGTTKRKSLWEKLCTWQRCGHQYWHGQNIPDRCMMKRHAFE
jgi:hypothetical protein